MLRKKLAFSCYPVFHYLWIGAVHKRSQSALQRFESGQDLLLAQNIQQESQQFQGRANVSEIGLTGGSGSGCSGRRRSVVDRLEQTVEPGQFQFAVGPHVRFQSHFQQGYTPFR